MASNPHFIRRSSATAATSPHFVRVNLPGSSLDGKSGVVLNAQEEAKWRVPARSLDPDGPVNVLLDSLQVISIFYKNLKPVASTVEKAIAPRKSEVWESKRFDERERSWAWRHKCPSITRSQ